MDYDYWLRPKPGERAFAHLEWEKPERRDQRGRLATIGGTKLGFAAVATSYQESLEAGAGEVRAVLPDALQPMLGRVISSGIFTPSNKIGAFAAQAEQDMRAAAGWADMLLLPGDAGRNSETAICLEHLLSGSDTPAVITRDAIDLLRANPQVLLDREKTALVVSFAQLQKLLQSVYFPRSIVFSMHLSQLVEVLHKASLSYPAMLVTYHSEQLVIALDGKVASLGYDMPMRIWRGSTASALAVALMQHPGKWFEAAVHAATA
ncbi:hypothetical protein JNJ66_04550 [Candidatus Saccharibacteria bacterium]|nr:hypothetical protein [Candidatus Saccharibacteria bacterium]